MWWWWRLRSPRSTVSKLETQETKWCSSSPNAGESQCSNLKRGRENPFSLRFSFPSDLGRTAWGPPTLGTAICFRYSSHLEAPSRTQPDIMFKQTAGHWVAPWSWHRKWTLPALFYVSHSVSYFPSEKNVFKIHSCGGQKANMTPLFFSPGAWWCYVTGQSDMADVLVIVTSQLTLR